MKIKPLLALAAITLLTASTLCTTSLAAPRKKIKTLDLTVKAEIFPEGSVFNQQAGVTVKGTKADVGECTFINDGFQWAEGDTPRLEVELHAADGYYFDVPTEGVTVHGGIYITQRQEDFKETLIVTIDLPKVGEFTENIKSVSWDTDTKAGWKQDEKGWWYQKSDGTWPMNSWESIDGQWYYFGDQGYMATGWVSWNGNQYYCDMTDGHMLTRTVTPDGSSVGEDGARLP